MNEDDARKIIRLEIQSTLAKPDTDAVLVELELLARRAAEITADAAALEDAIGALMHRLAQTTDDATPGHTYDRIHALADLNEEPS